MKKKFYKKKEDIIELVSGLGSCYASDKIMILGESVGYMYKEKPESNVDSGWRFFSGTETQDYADNFENFGIYDTNTVANYDNSIIPYLKLEVGSELEKVNSNKFKKILD